MSFLNSCIAVVATLMLTIPARAQTPASEPAPAAEPAPAPESSAAATARISVDRAKALVTGGDYNAALAELTRAQELLRGDPRQADVLNNIAVCYERMFRYDLALHYYERYLRESTTASAKDRAEVEAAMAVLIDLLGTVRVTGLAGADVWIDDNKLGQVPLEVLVPAGSHLIEIRSPNYEALRRELRVTARTTHLVDAQLAKIERYEGLPSTYFWIGAALTGAVVITGTAFGIAALSEQSAGQRQADNGKFVDSEAADDLALQADVAFGAAIALGVGTTVLFFLTDWSGGHTPERSPSAVQVALGSTSRSVSLSVKGVLP